MPGLPLTRSDVDLTIGDATRDVNVALKRVEDLRDGLQARTDQELVDLGYGTEDVTLIRASMEDMHTLWQVYRGSQAQTPAKDFRANIKKLWGLGVES